MHGPTTREMGQSAEPQALHHDPLTGKRGVPVEQHGHDFIAQHTGRSGVLVQLVKKRVLFRSRFAQDDGVDGFEVGGVL